MRAPAFVLLALLGCGGESAKPDAPVVPHDSDMGGEVTPDADPLATLDGTGLCLDSACAMISPDVRSYEPRYQLWSDTATKRRWVQLPAGEKIDTTDPDHWVFPVGTKLWKEFTRDGIRVETRYITKLLADDNAPGAWFYIAYAWNAEQTLATAADGAVMDANGTMHDIPSRSACRNCHDRYAPTRVLGFGAISLDYTAPAGELDLDGLIAMNALTANPVNPASPHYPFPVAATETDKAAFGYLHANCGGCHNATSPVHDQTPIELRIETTKLATVAGMPAYATTVDKDAAIPFTENGTTYTKIIISADPDNSALIARMKSASVARKMPPTATEIVDPAGQTALRAWVNAL